VSVITGGPGTGKTTTVMKVLLLLLEQETTAGYSSAGADWQGRSQAIRVDHASASQRGYPRGRSRKDP
jgi:ATP-dependent exoDNAse (exonuclease V) alpha subunit